MKRTLLSTPLLLLVGLCGPSAHAACTQYTPSSTLIAPANGSTYDAVYPSTTAQVPASVTNQWVDISGDPNTVITLRYSMSDFATQRLNGGNSNPTYIAHDWAGPLQIGTDKTGHWHRNVNNNSSGSLSANFNAAPGGYSFTGGSILEDSSGNQTVSIQSVTFTVNGPTV